MSYSKKTLIGVGAFVPALIVGCSGGGSGGSDPPPAAPAAVDQPPTISSVSPQSIDEGAVLGPIEIAVADAETPAARMLVSARADDSSLLPGTGIEVVESGGQHVLYLTPAEGQSGKTNVIVEATDGNGARTAMTFAVDVQPLFDGEFSGWMRSVVLGRNEFDTSVGEANEDGSPLPGPEDIPRIRFSDDSEANPAAYDDLLPAEHELESPEE
jgi:hypothetical protein